MTFIRELKIDQFRRLSDLSIPLNRRVSLLVGQNGTAKSTILGMLAQPFSFGKVRGSVAGKPDSSVYSDNYHGLVLSDLVDIAARPFMYDCDDVFRLSRRFDKPEETYRYSTVLDDFVESPGSPLDFGTLVTEGKPRAGRQPSHRLRFVTGPGGSHKAGEGNFPHPVMFLGLSRLWPLADSTDIEFPSDLVVTPEEKAWFVDQYAEILCIDEMETGAKVMKTREKARFISADANDYDGESWSAGQDNLGQILSALVSFNRLKVLLGDRYCGGLLLIDELDATLHPFAQGKLLDLLLEESNRIDLQVVATTHSTDLLKAAVQSPQRKDVDIVFLASEDHQVVTREFEDLTDLEDWLHVRVSRPKAKKVRRVPILLEDSVARQFFSALCGSRLRKFVNVVDWQSHSYDVLERLKKLSEQIPQLAECIFIADGDVTRHKKGMHYLPGKVCPETLIFRHLHGLQESDPFWKLCGNTYTKQFAISAAGGRDIKTADDSKWAKHWFKKQEKHWGYNNRIVFESFMKANPKECLAFVKKFLAELDKKFDPRVPAVVRDRIESNFQP